MPYALSFENTSKKKSYLLLFFSKIQKSIRVFDFVWKYISTFTRAKKNKIDHNHEGKALKSNGKTNEHGHMRILI